MSSSLTADTLLDLFPTIPRRFYPHLERYVRCREVTLTEDEFREATSCQTPFTVMVLNELRTLKPGETVTYGELARRIGRPKAVRAVGSALGRNPLPVLIPCHRVTAKAGPGGFAFGLDAKKMLLDFEALHP